MQIGKNSVGREIRNVLICGYGVMGHAVATTFAAAGFHTVIYSRRAASLTDLPPGSTAIDSLPDAAPDLAIEFASENVGVKQAVFRHIETAYPSEEVIIATGTSGLDLVELAKSLVHPERFVGLHYFMPADSSPVVEVMAGPSASAELVDRVADAVAHTGKEPLRLYKPVVGFLLNRLQHAILHEAYYLIEAGVASAADIDHAARRLLAPRMCLNGLIRQKDISGLNIHADAQRSIVPALFHNGIPNPMLQAMVARGETGLAAEKGFYDWTGRDVKTERARASRELAALLDFLDEMHRDAEAEPPARELPPR
jgi:3-hydroxybutyryl-CoA dehydrogenase